MWFSGMKSLQGGFQLTELKVVASTFKFSGVTLNFVVVEEEFESEK